MRSNPRLVVGGSVLVLVVILITSLALYWRYANHLPDYTWHEVKLPVPNARDDYVAAGKMCQAVGGSKVLAAPGKEAPGARPSGSAGGAGDTVSVYGTPVLRNGQVLVGYEEGVTRAQRRAVVERNRAALARLRQGLGKKQFASPPILSARQTFPELTDYRELARVLVTEGKLAEQEGRPNDAPRSYLDCLRLGIDAPRGGPLIHGLVGIAILMIGMRPIQEVTDRLDGPTAAAAAREMVRLDAQALPLAETFTLERDAASRMYLEMFRHPERLRQMAATGNPPPAPPSLPETAVARLVFGLVPKKQVIDGMRGYMDALSAGARRPPHARPALPPLPRDPWSRILMPVMNQAMPKWDQRDAHWRVTTTRLAVRAYQQRHGALPPSLAALVPTYLPSVPQDPYAPKPLIYRQQGTRALVYSRGPDGDDDGGKDLGSRVEPGSDGDVVTMRSPRRR